MTRVTSFGAPPKVTSFGAPPKVTSFGARSRPTCGNWFIVGSALPQEDFLRGALEPTYLGTVGRFKAASRNRQPTTWQAQPVGRFKAAGRNRRRAVGCASAGEAAVTKYGKLNRTTGYRIALSASGMTASLSLRYRATQVARYFLNSSPTSGCLRPNSTVACR